MLYIVFVYTPETAECLEKENLFYENQRGSNAGVFLLCKINSKVPLELQEAKGCHSPFSCGLVTSPQPAPLRGNAESPKNRGSRSTRRALGPDLPGCLSSAEMHFQSSGNTCYEVWPIRGWDLAGRFSVRIICKDRRTTHTRHCNPGIYCLCFFPCGQYLQCNKTQRWANTDLWSALEDHVGTMRAARQ